MGRNQREKRTFGIGCGFLMSKASTMMGQLAAISAKAVKNGVGSQVGPRTGGCGRKESEDALSQIPHTEEVRNLELLSMLLCNFLS